MRGVPPMSDAPAEATGRRWWASVEQLADSESFADKVKAEFPSLFEFWQVDRRELLRVMGASLALAGVSGCNPARSDDAVPLVESEQGVGADTVRHYATAVLTEGYAQPVLATTVAGRPIKLEGNPRHPASGGATSFLAQAAILDLYDPDRSQGPLLSGSAATWGDFDGQMMRWRDAWRKSGGAGLRLLVAPTTSPTLIRQISQLKAAFPNLRVRLFDPLDGYSGLGEPQPLLSLENVRVVVSLDDDFLGPGPAQVVNARGWAKRRGDVPNSERTRLFMAEATPTLTGANAQHRIGVAPSRIPLLAAAIAAGLGAGSEVRGLTPEEFGWATSAAQALARDPGSSLLTVGRFAEPQLHAIAGEVNQRLGNGGKTIQHAAASTLVPDGSFIDLGRDIEAGRVGALFILGANPAYATPGDIDFKGLCGRVPLKVHAGLYADETAAVSDWHLPLAHSLEDWSDARSVDGLATIMQPVIAPLYDTRSIHTILAGFTTEGTPPNALSIVRSAWAGKLAGEDSWNDALKTGFVPGTEGEPAPPLRPATVPWPARAGPQPGQVEVVIRPDPSVGAGEGANNGWLQELPKPLTKVTWDNVIAISPALAQRLDLGMPAEPDSNNVPLLQVAVGGRLVSGPAFVLPGQPDNVVTLYLGYGRRAAGRVGNGVGYDAYPLRTMDRPWSAIGSIRATGKTVPLATTQTHHLMEDESELPVVSSAGTAVPKPAEQESLYPRWKEGERAWGMVIDNDLCIGCNACITACQAENNVPVVGKKQVYEGREMHWLRVSRLYSGKAESPRTVFQPVPCMHCEQAPCEMGCPVHATVHSPEGLNLMVYNRCIGTRTCSSYCPYKVRRFNWFDYTSSAAPSIAAQRNPDVTVRGRGVMEKCTYCIQRISGAEVAADIDNRAISEGEVKTACQQACPTSAITFGDLADAASAVSKQRASPRNYSLLGQLGTRPRTTYLAKIEEDEQA
jgi:MoCo/4Fe-4S cofactor protein with predicted Tat translocation signal